MIEISDIEDLAAKAVRAKYAIRNVRAFSEKPLQDRIVAERKRQLREWIAVLRIVRNPLNHSRVMARVTDNGTFPGRNLMAHDLRNRVILGGLDAALERAQDQEARKMNKQLCKKIVIVVSGDNESDLEDGINEAARLIKDGCVAGKNSNDTGAFYFEVDNDVPEGEWPADSRKSERHRG